MLLVGLSLVQHFVNNLQRYDIIISFFNLI